jgi:hypothetical protein
MADDALAALAASVMVLVAVAAGAAGYYHSSGWLDNRAPDNAKGFIGTADSGVGRGTTVLLALAVLLLAVSFASLVMGWVRR